jgi:hypothetical protein
MSGIGAGFAEPESRLEVLERERGGWTEQEDGRGCGGMGESCAKP